MSAFGGIDWLSDAETILPALRAWVIGGSGLTDDKVVCGEQDGPRPPAPAIVMRISNAAAAGRPWTDFVPNPLAFSPLTITSVDPATDHLVVATGHGLATGDGPIRIASTGALPGGLAPATDYWVIADDALNFRLAASFSGTGGRAPNTNPKTPIDLTTAGTGTITVSSTDATVRAGASMLAFSRGLIRVTLELRCHAPPVPGNGMAVALLNAVRGRCALPSQKKVLRDANIGLIEAERVRAIQGVRDAVLFEPRAYLDVHFYLASEDSEFADRIDTVLVTDNGNRVNTIG